MFLHSDTGAGLGLLLNDAHRLIRPLTISLLLHALIFWTAPGALPSPESSATRRNDLHANLHRPPAAAEPIEKPQFSPAPSTETTQARQPETREYSPPDRQTTPEAGAASPMEQDRPEARPNLPVEPMQSGVDIAGLQQYHLALGQQARQFRRYPEEARKAGWKGRVTMRLVVSATGAPLGISLLDSSSFPILDQAAIDMMLLAASHTEVPESLRGRAFSIDLAIDYNPDDAP